MSKHRHIPRTPGYKLVDGDIHEQVLVRQVLRPGKHKAAMHPWAPLLFAARTGADEELLAELREQAGIVR